MSRSPSRVPQSDAGPVEPTAAAAALPTPDRVQRAALDAMHRELGTLRRGASARAVVVMPPGGGKTWSAAGSPSSWAPG